MVLGFIIKDCGGASSAPTAHRVAKTASDAMLSLPQRLPQLAAVMGCWVCMNTSRTSARGSCGRNRCSPLRPRSTHTPAMPSDATCGWPCLHPPCAYARTPSRTLQRTRAHAAERKHARACRCWCLDPQLAYANRRHHTHRRDNT